MGRAFTNKVHEWNARPDYNYFNTTNQADKPTIWTTRLLGI